MTPNNQKLFLSCFRSLKLFSARVVWQQGDQIGRILAQFVIVYFGQ
jgi:hypothetical protein